MLWICSKLVIISARGKVKTANSRIFLKRAIKDCFARLVFINLKRLGVNPLMLHNNIILLPSCWGNWVKILSCNETDSGKIPTKINYLLCFDNFTGANIEWYAVDILRTSSGTQWIFSERQATTASYLCTWFLSI